MKIEAGNNINCGVWHFCNRCGYGAPDTPKDCRRFACPYSKPAKPQIKPGDIVHVRMLKLEEEKQWAPCYADGRTCSTLEAVFHVEPRPIAVGDRVNIVRGDGAGRNGHVEGLSKDGYAALVHAGLCEYACCRVQDLEIVP